MANPWLRGALIPATALGMGAWLIADVYADKTATKNDKGLAALVAGGSFTAWPLYYNYTARNRVPGVVGKRVVVVPVLLGGLGALVLALLGKNMDVKGRIGSFAASQLGLFAAASSYAYISDSQLGRGFVAADFNPVPTSDFVSLTAQSYGVV
jgi:predicted membrane-bound spermidine synthase